MAELSGPSSYVVLLSGTHVTGKDTLAVSLAASLACPWLEAGLVQTISNYGARAQARTGYSYEEVFGRIWFSKMQRRGFLYEGTELDKGFVDKMGSKFVGVPRKNAPECTALLTCFHMRKHVRDAIRDVLLAHSVRAIFVILQITEETLSGRTLGAEEPELAERIMGDKIADIQMPLEDEQDVIILDSMQDSDALFLDARERICQYVG